MQQAEKLRLVERAIWEGVEAESDNEVVFTPSWVQKTTPAAPTAFLNGVFRCELGEEEAPAKVRETVARYRELGLPFRWKTSPSSLPKNLRALLHENGLAVKERLYGLIALPGALSFPENAEVRVEALGAANLEDWLKVQASAWKVPPPGIAYLRASVGGDRKSGGTQNFLAYYRSEPVASAAVRFYRDYAFLTGAAVNPDVRGKGIYRSLLGHRLRLIGERGLPAVIHCLENTSAPICLKLGFEKVCEIESFENA